MHNNKNTDNDYNDEQNFDEENRLSTAFTNFSLPDESVINTPIAPSVLSFSSCASTSSNFSMNNSEKNEFNNYCDNKIIDDDDDNEKDNRDYEQEEGNERNSITTNITINKQNKSEIISFHTTSSTSSTPRRFTSTECLTITSQDIRQIPVYVETLTGKTFEFQVLPDETVYTLKFKLQMEEGIPASQQHLIWQGEELKDEFTFDEYGIGFGAILKLVLGLKVGPIVDSPLNTANSVNERDEQETSNVVSGGGGDDGDARPLTVFIFQNGNEISIVTLNSGNLNKINDVSDYDDNVNNIKFNNDEKIKENFITNERKRENELLKEKINTLQSKMRNLSLKKKRRKISLPAIENKNISNKQSIYIQIQNNINLSNECDNKFYLPSLNKSIELRKQRSNSISFANSLKTTDEQLNSLNSIIFPQLKMNKDKTEKQNESINKFDNQSSITKRQQSSNKRPKTTPTQFKVTNYSEILRNLRSYKESKQSSYRVISGKSKRINEANLPPVVKLKKLRCQQCKKKLSLIGRFQCRCRSFFCSLHRYSEAHNCSFNYKLEGQKILQNENPKILSSKLPKI